MKRILSIALALGLAVLGSTVIADPVTHIVRIEGPGYFPNIIYYKNGDYVKFENRGFYPARLKTNSGAWYTYNIATNATSPTFSLGTTSSFGLKGPFYLTGNSYFYGPTYQQYRTNFALNFVKADAPTSCPDTRVICN